jgi:hydroxypyruvate isomerase
MLRFAANLSFLYNELSFLERFGAARRDGFAGVEYLFPYEYPAEEIATRLKEHRLQQVLFNAPPGDWAAGERGTSSLPGRAEEFRASIYKAMTYAEALGCAQVHVMAGVVPMEEERKERWEIYRERLAWAAGEAASHGVDILIEPINLRDMPGYLLNYQEEAHRLAAEIGAPNLKVQMDLYHCQVTEGDVSMRLRRYLSGDPRRVAHLQIAGVPGRQEPDEGELNYPHLFALVEELGYEGWIGCEYRPRASTSEGLGWRDRALQRI